ncbi:MAG: PTS system mannose/fructose/sorbose family transporter subunit IID [Candidatus Asgardarchaeia archaeon]
MAVNVFQAFLIFLWTLIAYMDALTHFSWMNTPTMTGTVIGTILGDPVTGLIIGGTCELVFLGIYPVGGARPPEPIIGTVVGTTVAVSAGLGVELALAVAVPVAILGAQLFTVLLTASVIFIHLADKFNEKGEFRKAYITHIVAGPTMICAGMGVIPFIAALYGAEPFTALNEWVSANAPWIWTALSVGARLMVPVGIAALLIMYWDMRFIPFFLLGFTLTAAAGIGLVPVAVLGACLAIIFYVYTTPPTATDGGEAEGGEEKRVKKLTKADIFGVFLRHYLLQNSWCYERMQALGYYFSVMPVITKLYPKEEAIERGKVHLEFYNTNPDTSALIVGIDLALEEQGADINVIRNVKNGLMGPLAGVGDSIFGFALRAIVVSIGASMALQGNFFGPIFNFLGGLLIMGLAKWYFINYGYTYGLTLVQKIREVGLEKVNTSVGILGTMAMGSVVATWVSINTPIVFVSGGVELVVLQNVLDSIMPKILPLTFLVLAVTLMKRGLTLSKTMILFFFMGVILAYPWFGTFGILS